MDYILHLIVMILIYSILAMSWNLIGGYAGLFSIAHAALFGIGAYTSSLLVMKLGVSFWLGVTSAFIVTGLVAVAVGVISLRFKGDYFALATIGLHIIVIGVFTNWVSLTGGPFGLYGIPRPSLLGAPSISQAMYASMVLLIAAALYLIIWSIVSSPLGRILKAIREDETCTQLLGKNTVFYKSLVFSLCAGFAGIAGALYAHYIQYIGPSTFGIGEAFFIPVIVIVGGAGDMKGPVIGATFLVLLPELMRFVGLTGQLIGPIQQMIYGLVLVMLMLFRPNGIVGRVRF